MTKKSGWDFAIRTRVGHIDFTSTFARNDQGDEGSCWHLIDGAT